jgi:hypothetical protein
MVLQSDLRWIEKSSPSAAAADLGTGELERRSSPDAVHLL